MKKIEANRYPNSATLFKFCKEALGIRYEGNVKVIDQDVGAILGYDPADCSHWKKGKKNIRALATLRSIADHLNIDERLLIEIASGQIGLEEAVFEYRGYGSTSLNGRQFETLKKEFFQNPGRWQSDGSVAAFEQLFDVNRPAVLQMVEAVMTAGSFSEAPIYMPEVFQMYNNLNLVASEDQEEAIKTTVTEGENGPTTTVTFRGAEMRPYVRYLLAREVFLNLVRVNHPLAVAFANSPAEVNDIRANIFAGMLLVPGPMLRKEVEGIDSSLDIVSQLADTFWISKGLMNQRLRDYMENLT